MGAADYIILGIIAVCVVLAWRAWHAGGGCSCSGGGCCGDCASCRARAGCAKRK